MNAAFIKAGCRAAAIVAVIALSACNQSYPLASPVSAGDAASSVSEAAQQASEPVGPVAPPNSAESAAASQPAESAVASARAQNPPAQSSASQPSASQSVSPPSPAASGGVSAIPALADIEKFYARNPEQYTYVGTWVDFAWSQDHLTDVDREIMEGLSLFQGLTPTDETLKIGDCDF